MSSAARSIFDYLSASPTARHSRSMDLGCGRMATIWHNAHDRMRYEQTAGHTFSLYLKDGQGVKRVDKTPVSGWPGALCIMPQGHSSEWEITQPFEFLHLYIPDAQMRSSFAEIYDKDARLMELPDMTYGSAPLITASLGKIAAAIAGQHRLAAEQAMAEVIKHSCSQARGGRYALRPLQGGLAAHAKRRVQDYIESHLETTIRLRDLATLAQLSEFHFQRMFHVSFGLSPHHYVQVRRISRAKHLLQGADSMAHISVACGFSSQSHMTRVFKNCVGTTPAAYRQQL